MNVIVHIQACTVITSLALVSIPLIGYTIHRRYFDVSRDPNDSASSVNRGCWYARASLMFTSLATLVTPKLSGFWPVHSSTRPFCKIQFEVTYILHLHSSGSPCKHHFTHIFPTLMPFCFQLRLEIKLCYMIRPAVTTVFFDIILTN
jgi:hypothetical protein